MLYKIKVDACPMLTALNEVSSFSLLPDNWSGITAKCMQTLREDASGRYASFLAGLNMG